VPRGPANRSRDLGAQAPEAGDPLGRSREVLRQTSEALEHRVVTLWEIAAGAEAHPLVTSVASPPYHETALDLGRTLRHWGLPLVTGSRWVGCRLNDDGRWCLAPVRRQPAAPPPDGIERRSRERLTLELAGLCLGAVGTAPAVAARVGNDEVAGSSPLALTAPLSAARASLKLSFERLRTTDALDARFRAGLFDELAGVSAGLELVELIARGGEPAVSGAFDPGRIVQLSVVLERPLARAHAVGLQASISPTPLLRGAPDVFFRVVTTLVRDAVGSGAGSGPALVRLEPSVLGTQLTVSRPAETRPVGGEHGTGGALAWPHLGEVRRVVREAFGGRVIVPAEGPDAVTVELPRASEVA